ncbi:uncharacterized protein LOC588928 isoform X14 [Strongylocentrotus purpuratus]|uniref:Hyalin n=1 Tax=Strongylocentrotus purpuratus TaxID=7668 RepID=A0A7M7N2M3_STRPU|nr:uncharacterized protein LOC588928 isoform X14 [Strongylocentrotus purpuratus]
MAQDAYGNAATCLININVYDNETPSLQGCNFGDISQPTDAASDQAVVNWTPPVGLDNAGAPTVSSNYNPGMAFPVGVTTVTYTATDAAGLTSMCSFNISVSDSEPPMYSSCPNEQSGYTSINETTFGVSWSIPAATDNVGVVLMNQTHVSGYAFSLGVTTVVNTAYDAAGNKAECSFNVTISDNIQPTISGCPSSIEVNAPSTLNGSVVTWTPIIATDAFGIASQNSTHINGSFFNIGSVSVVYSFVDTNGNEATCTFAVTVLDVTRPVASGCPSNTTVEPDLGSLNATVNLTAPVFTDNSGNFSLNSGPAPSVFELGTTLVLYQATDDAGNIGSCGVYVTVLDTVPPVLTGCPSNMNVTTDPGNSTASVSWSAPVATDNSIEPSLNVTKDSGSLFDIGDTLVSYFATDPAGLVAQCTFTVTVRDEELPVFTDCPTGINLTLPADASMVNATWSEPTATDNSLSVMTSSSMPLYTVLATGALTVTYTAVDPSGNKAQCSFTLSVFDVTPPVITCPSDISVNTGSGIATAAVTWDAVNATDNSNAVMATTDIPSGSNFVVGDTVVTAIALDSSNNEATCNFTVTVSDIEAPVFITCPVDMAFPLPSSGAATRAVTWTTPIASDNTIVYTMAVNVTSGSRFSLGPTVVQYSATDLSNNVEYCTFTVTITDSTAPTFTNCNTTTITQSTDANSANATVIWSEPTASDNSAQVTVTSTYSPGDSIPVGNNAVEYLAVDSSGNNATCTFFVIIEDTEAPLFPGCPAMILTAQDAGKVYATVTWQLVASDNVGVVNETATYANGSQFDLGSTEVILEAVDAAGNMGVCNFTVIVQDQSAPIIRNCPGTTLSAANLNTNSSVAYWQTPTATDPNGGVTSTSNYQPLDRFFIGLTTVTYVFTDTAGNEGNCTFIVEITDTQDPVITGCPSNITVGPDPGLVTAVVNWTEPTITDNSYSVTVTQNEYPNTMFNGGTVTVSYVATDPSGKTKTCSFTVTVTDNVAPVISQCPSNMTSFTDSGNATAFLSWAEPTATDNSEPPNVTSTAYSPSYFGIGETTVTYTATDTFQLTDSCSFTVTVIDNELPVISNCTLNQEFVVDSNSDNSNVTWSLPIASDNSGELGLTANIDPGTVLGIGDYVVTYTATDSSGNTDNCTFTVGVLDQTPPTFSQCDRTITVIADTNLATGLVTWNVSATDNNGIPTVESTGRSGLRFVIGNDTVDFTATDSSNNTATCSLNIQVLDEQKPTISNCPVNITVDTDPGSNGATVTWTEPTASDNSGSVTLLPNIASGSVFSIGYTDVLYTADDLSGNEEQCSFVVRVTDNELPVFTYCNTTTIVQNTDLGQNYATVSWALPTAMDNDGISSLSSRFNPLDTFSVGETSIRYHAEDNSGNEAICPFTVDVRDNEAPAFAGCPSDVTIILRASESFQSVSWIPPTVSDNVMVASNTSSATPGSNFYSGMTVVTYYANDTAGNEMQCQFTIDVQDVSAPTLSTCPMSITYNSSTYMLGQGPLFETPNATDANGILSVMASHGPYDNFTLGSTMVDYVFTDNANLTSTCSFSVIIADDENPVVDFCPSAQTLEFNSNGSNVIPVSWMEPTFSDNSGNVTVDSSNGSVSSLGIGNHTITYTTRDPSGNQAMCSFVITIEDTIPPSLSSCPVDVRLVLANGTSTANVTWTAPTASDNGVVAEVVPSQQPPAAFSIGVTTVTYTARDTAGLTSTCSFNVTIIDVETPVISGCPSDITVSVEATESTSNVSWTEPTAADNSNNVGLTTSHSPYSIFSIGNTNVTYTATDGSGNSDTCLFVVTVLDKVNPLLNCSSSISLTTDAGQATASDISASVSATDNAGTPVLTSNLPGDEAGVGVTMVTVTATDGSGNMAMCQFNITVSDDEGPTYTPCPEDLLLNTTNVASWTIPVPSDNTGVVATSVFSHEPGVFSSGTTVVSYNATDQYGNLGTCQFSVTVDANGSPEVSGCPSDVTVNSSVATFSTNVTWTEPSVNDSDTVNTTQSHYPGDSFPIGVTEVTYLFTDTTGRSTSCVFDVTVILLRDNVPPVFDYCPIDFTVYTEVGSTNRTIFWTESIASDATGLPVTLTSNYASGETFSIGNLTVQVIATDTFNNTASCNFTIELIEDFAPVIENCSSDIAQDTDPGAPNAIVTWMEPVGSDANGAVTTRVNYSPGNIFPLGTTVINYEVTDRTNNTADCSFRVTISDNEKPTFTFCPSDVTVYIQDNATSGNVAWTVPVAEDNVNVVSLLTTSSQGTYNVGSYSVVYRASDAGGNEELCSFTVEVIEDQSPTIVGCPSDITQPTDAGVNDATVSWTEPSVTDDRVNATLSAPNFSSGDTFPLGSTTVMYSATDIGGNTATCSFTVIVQDEEDPVILNCPSAITDYTPASTTVSVTWTEPTSTDNDNLASLMTNIQPGTPLGVGVSDVIYTAVDDSGNSATCTFQITILEDMPPTITGCPSNIEQNTDVNSATAVVMWSEPVGTDDLGTPNMTSDVASGSAFGIGTTPVTYTAIDSASQTTTCTFDVVIRDRENPVLMNCPTEVSATIAPDAATTAVSWTPPTATDNSGSVIVTPNLMPGVLLGTGFEVVIYIAIDESGNRDVCNFVITVSEDQAPVVSDCPSDQSVGTDAGQNYASVSWTEPTATDDTGNVTVSISPSSTQYPLGTTAVTYTFTDSINLTSTCSYSVTVQDREDPVFSGCPTNINELLPASQLPVTVSWTAPMATDNTGNVSMDVNIESGSSFPEGTHEISYTATDDYGNSDVCMFSVIITVDQPPTFTFCPSAINTPTDAGVDYTSVTWTSATAIDDNGAVNLTSDYQSGDSFTIGSRAVTITATDSAGSSSTCTFDVTVNDEEKPALVNCSSDITVYVTNSVASASVTWAEPSVTDNSGESIIPNSNMASGTRFSNGSITVLYSATDSSQNVDTCSFVVIVQVATSLSQYVARLKLNRIRDQVGPFTQDVIDSSLVKLQEDFENLFRQSSVSTYFAGVQISSAFVDPSSDLSAIFEINLYFKEATPAVTNEAIQSAFDASLTNNKFDVNNEVPQPLEFYITPGPCSSTPCQNSGTCTALDRVSFECTCTAAWTGTLCTTDVDECSKGSPCTGENQVCLNTAGGFTCQCSSGFANVNDACIKVASSFGGAFDIEMIDGRSAIFSSDLNDETSSAYTALESRVTSAIDEVYVNTTGYLMSKVISFSSGSIKVEYELLFETPVDSTSVESMINKSISESTGELSQTAIIIKTSSVITVQELCPVDYCENDGICVITVGLQRQCICEDNFEGDQCEINLSGIPTFIIVLIVAAGLLVIIVLVLLALCFFIMRTSNDKDSGNFIYSVEGGQENFTFGHTRDDMIHMRGPLNRANANADHVANRPSNPDRSELRTTREDAGHHRHVSGRSGRRRQKGERFYHDTPPPSYNGTGVVVVGREARELSRPLVTNTTSASRPNDMGIHQLYAERPGMEPQLIPEDHESSNDTTQLSNAVDVQESMTDAPTATSNQQPYIATGQEAATVYGHRNVENEPGYF